MAEPTSRPAMLFADIEGSTQLAAGLGPAWRDVLHRFREVARAAWVRHGGREIDTAGDGFYVVFATVPPAVLAAVDAQRELTDAAWPGGVQVRVRIGVHVGTAVEYEDGYVGYEVHRAARITAAAHGGQVLASAAVAGEAPTDDRITCVDLGRHPLKDLAEDEQLFQVCAPGLPASFPAVRTGADAALAQVPSTFRNDVAIPPAALLMPDGRTLTVTAYGVRIGRTPDNDLVLADGSVSRHHCAINATGGGFILTDLQSTHGSFVNDDRVGAPLLLGDGDRLRLGSTEIGFRWPA